MPEMETNSWRQHVREALVGLSVSATREAEIVEELSQHLADREQELLASGRSTDEARNVVMAELAGHELIQQLRRVEQANTEAPALGGESGGNFWSSLIYDVRYALRLLKLNPSFTAVAVISLALGIGANTAIFQLLDAVRLRTLPVKDPQELALVKLTNTEKGRTGNFRGYASTATYQQWEEIRQHQQSFSGIFAWGVDNFNLASGGEVRLARALYVSGDFFNVLGITSAAGRLLTSSDDQKGCGVGGVVLSYPFWRREFAQDPSAIGRKIQLDGHSFEIAGVTPPGFFGIEVGRSFDVALPMCAEAIMRAENSGINRRDSWWVTIMGRLKPGVSLQQATAQLNIIALAVFKTTLPERFNAEDADVYLKYGLSAVSGASGTSSLRKNYESPLWLLLGIAGLVLLIACANLANLMLARATAREREIAVRLALGAARGRLIRQLLTESLLLAGIGALSGLIVAFNVSHMLINFLNTADRPIFVELTMDWHMFSFTALLALLTCLLFGLAPALRATRTSASAAMNASSRSTTAGRERNGLRRGLVVTQVALSLILLVSATLFVRSLNHLMTLDAGFRRDGILVANLDLSQVQMPPGQRVEYNRRLLDKLHAIAGIESVAQTNIVPISGSGWNRNIEIDQKNKGISNFIRVSPAYLKTIGTPLLAGRDFDQRDTAGSPVVAIVNQQFARKILGTENPVGKTFRLVTNVGEKTPTYEVIGLAKDTKYEDLRSDFEPLAYVADVQDDQPDQFPSYLIRSDLPLETVVAGVKSAMAEVNPAIALEFRNFNTQIRETLARERMLASLSGFFGLLAGVLAVVGIYGVISYMVARRTNEIGIRMALGANRGNILGLIMREAGVLLGIGLVIGTGLAFAAARSAASLLYGLKPTDLVTYAGAIATLTCVTAGASMLPAHRAARLDPMAALRDE
jgi:putative ABC transport system permease protein